MTRISVSKGPHVALSRSRDAVKSGRRSPDAGFSCEIGLLRSVWAKPQGSRRRSPQGALDLFAGANREKSDRISSYVAAFPIKNRTLSAYMTG